MEGKEDMSSDKLIRGTLILTLATLISKILGLVYVIPFTAMVGTDGYILFEYAYKPYGIMISLATMGLPLAVSKFVSKYNELGDYRMGRIMLKRGMVLLSVTGFIWFLILFFSAPAIAHSLVGNSDGTGNKLEDVVFVIRMVSVALIIVPPMALLRGFFQGYQYMTPTAISQVIEQFVRVAMILIGGLVILNLLDLSKTVAVGFATFAAFVSAVVAMWILLRYWKKNKSQLDEKLKESKTVVQMNTYAMFKELFSYAIPFVIVGLAIALYQMADTFMINKALIDVNYSLEKAEEVNSVVALVQKVILIPMALATAFALSLVPAITQSFTAKNMELLHHQIKKTFQINMYLTFPAVAGLMILADEIYAMMFGTGTLEMGGHALLWYAPIAIVYTFFTVTAAMLQGLNKHNLAVVSFLVGFVIKIVINVPLIQHFEAIGTVLSTTIGFGLSIIINLWVIRKEANYRYRTLVGQLIHILFLVVAMVLAVALIKLGNPWIEGWIGSVYGQYVVKALIGVVFGGFVYVFVSIQTPIFRQVFGNKYLFLDKLKLFKK